MDPDSFLSPHLLRHSPSMPMWSHNVPWQLLSQCSPCPLQARLSPTKGTKITLGCLLHGPLAWENQVLLHTRGPQPGFSQEPQGYDHWTGVARQMLLNSGFGKYNLSQDTCRGTAGMLFYLALLKHLLQLPLPGP